MSKKNAKKSPSSSTTGRTSVSPPPGTTLPRSQVVGAALEQPKAAEPQLRYVLVVRVTDKGQMSYDISAFQNDVTKHEVGKALHHVLGVCVHAKDPYEVIEPLAVAQRRQHEETVLRDYPAVKFHAKNGWCLCAACWDAYAGVAAPEEEFTDLPRAIKSAACTFHLSNFAEAPMSYEQASELKTQLEEDRARSQEAGSTDPLPDDLTPTASPSA